MMTMMTNSNSLVGHLFLIGVLFIKPIFYKSQKRIGKIERVLTNFDEIEDNEYGTLSTAHCFYPRRSGDRYSSGYQAGEVCP